MAVDETQFWGRVSAAARETPQHDKRPRSWLPGRKRRLRTAAPLGLSAFFTLSSLFTSCNLACTPAREAASAGAQATDTAKAAAQTPVRGTEELVPFVSPARWQLLPESVSSQSDDLDVQGLRRVIREGVRVLDWPDGRLQQAEQLFPTGEVRAVELPERLGGGYLFTSELSGETLVWRSSSWLGEARPVATISERVERLVPGFDRLYAQLAHTHELLAFDPGSGKLTELGPLPKSHAYDSLAFVDEWFGVVDSDVRGPLATFDAGSSWHPVVVDGSNVELSVEGGAVLVQHQGGTTRISPDGQVVRGSSVDPTRAFAALNARYLPPVEESSADAPATPAPLLLPLGPRPLRDAVLYGWPLDREHALVAANGTLGKVRLADGQLVEHTGDAYYGHLPCRAVRFGTSAGFVCSETGSGTTIYRFEPPLQLSPVIHFSRERRVSASGNGLLVVTDACDGAGAPRAGARTYCIVADGTAPREIEVEGDVGVERVVALHDGRSLVLVPPRAGSPGKLSLLSANGQSETRTLRLPKTTKSLERLLTLGLWLDGATELSDGNIATWVAGGANYVGVKVKLDGTVELPKTASSERGDLGRAALAGRFALEVSASGVGWQTTDHGFSWTRVMLPRALEPRTPTRIQRDGSLHPVLGCSAVGCAYEPWLRIGYDGPGAEASADEVAEEAPVPARVAITPPNFSDWHFDCSPTGEVWSAPRDLARSLAERERERPRRGSSSGFGGGLPSNPKESDIDNGAYRPFWGMPGPQHDAATLRMDMGLEKPVEFRAYAWGHPGQAWSNSGAWLVRVATRFRSAAVWSTAPTQIPWTDWVQAAQVFGSDRASRRSTQWFAALDPDEESGLLWVSNPLGVSLHVLSRDKAISSSVVADVGKPAGVALVGGVVYLGLREGNQLQLHAVRSGRLERIADFPVGQGAAASLVRSSDSARLGILVHSLRGDWYVYPLDEELEPNAPLFVSRETLNQAPHACTSEHSGWLVSAALPLSRVTKSDSQRALSFSAPFSHLRTSDVAAKVHVTDGGVCVLELAATQRAGGRRGAGSDESSAPTRRIPLTVTDASMQGTVSFRCSP